MSRGIFCAVLLAVPGVGFAAPQGADDKALDQLVQDLKSTDAAKRNAACAALAQLPVNGARRPEVARVLGTLVGIKENNTRANALRALEKWATPDNLPDLLKQYEEKRIFDFNDLNRVLAVLPDERSVEQLFKQVGHFFDRSSNIPQNAIRKHGAALGLKHAVANMNHEHGDIRGLARQLLDEWKAQPDDLVKQSLQDVKSSEQDRRISALEWFSKNGPYPRWGKEVHAAVLPLANNLNFNVKTNAKAALKRWAEKP